MEKKLVWTVLPKQAQLGPVDPASGARPVQLDVSLFISPRLTPAAAVGTLAEFSFGGGDNFTSWVAQSTVRLQFGSAALSGTLISTPDPTLWPVLFPSTIPVRNFAYEDLSTRKVLSFPVDRVHNALDQVYGELATAVPTEYPDVLGNASPGLRVLFQALPAIQQQFGRTLTGRDTSINPGNDPRELIAADNDAQIAQLLGLTFGSAEADVGIAFYKAYGFYHRANRYQEQHDADLAPPPRPAVPDFDFHQMLTVLGDYPYLMRQLGLVLDYRVTLGRAGVDDDSLVQLLTPPPGDALTTHVTPRTRYLFDIDVPSFVAKPEAGSDLVDGLLDLSDPERHVVTQLDVDGSALKSVQHFAAISRVSQLRNAEAASPDLEQQRESVPSLRSDGVSVARIARKGLLTARFTAQNNIHGAFVSNTEADLGSSALTADDLLRGYRVDVLDRAASADWRSLCQRDGTYLAGTGGGQRELVASDEGYVKAASATGEETEPDLLFTHENLFSWPGWSLVAPRPGLTMVSPGDGDEVQEVANTPQTALDLEVGFKVTPGTLPRQRFGRTYRIRARSVDLAGNSLPVDSDASFGATRAFEYLRYEPIPQPQLVQREAVTEGESLEHMVIRSNRGVTVADYVQQPQVASSNYPEVNDRHVVAPKATQFMCESHGEFDALIDSEDPVSHQQSYLLAVKEAGTLMDRKVFNPATGVYDDVNAVLVDGPSTPEASKGVWPVNRGDELAAGQYVVLPDPQVTMPYLPDPLAVGLTLRDAQNGELYARTFEGSWPDRAPFRIVAREGTEVDVEPRVEVDGETLDVFLPKAAIFQLRYSSLPDADRLGEMAYFHRVVGDDAARAAAEAGTHWMFSPYRTLTLVHAVQQPLQDPGTAVNVDTARAQGQTFSRLLGTVDFHGQSSGQVDLRAFWIDPEDELTRRGPMNQRKEAQLGHFQPAYDEQQRDLGEGGGYRHEFGDTRHHRVVYQAVATTRFREYFPQALWQNEANITAQEPVFGEDGIELTKTTVDVLATTRPAAPDVKYIVPTFRWQTSEDGTRKVRLGGGLRVYLGRPWYSSGIGELLGALFEPNVGASEEHLRFSTQWASDPIRRNTAPDNPIRPQHFQNRVATDLSVQVAEKPELNVAVAGFNVEYNEDRQLWFADLELEMGDAYFPFIKLALARYQAKSLPGLELSTVVVSEFAQVAADRIANLTRNGSMLGVSVSGVTGDNTDGESEVPAPGGGDVIVQPPPPPGPAPDPGSVIVSPGNDAPAPVVSDVIALPPQAAGERARRHLVRVRLEERTGDSDLDWQQVGAAVDLTGFWTPQQPEEVVWSGDLPLTSGAQSSPANFRVVIEEHELYWSDTEVAAPHGPVPPPELIDDSSQIILGRSPSSRIVYMAVMDVPGPATGPTSVSAG